MKDLENKKLLGVPLGTVTVIVLAGIAVYVITSMWGSKILGWMRKGTSAFNSTKGNTTA